MTCVRLTAKDTDLLARYEAFLSTHPRGHFLQTPAWGRVKSEWTWTGLLAQNEAGQSVGALSVLCRRAPGLPYTFLYAPRGPVCDCHDAAVLQTLLSGVQQLAREQKSFRFLMDPDILASDKEFRRLAQSLGLSIKGDSKNFEGIQPRFVFRLPLTGQTEESLLASFHPKTRYNIRLAERKGVQVRPVDASYLPAFHSLMRETGQRDGFLTRPLAYFARMLTELGDNCRLYMAFYNEKPLAGALSIAFGDRVWYLYGASGNAQRQMMPNYLMQWEMIRWALHLGCSVYDFRGVSGDLDDENNPLAGLLRFKRGFGGELCEFIGDLELVTKPSVYFAIRQGEKMYALGKKGLRLVKNNRIGRRNANDVKPT